MKPGFALPRRAAVLPGTRQRLLICSCLLLLLVVGCTRKLPSGKSLSEARRGFTTHLVPQAAEKEPVEPAPPSVFRTIQYPSPVGQLAAYLSPDPGDGKKHPAIVWITGGDCNSIGDVWSPASRDNDQTAAAFRNSGTILLFPSLRGGNTNPGAKEGFLGEVDDVLAAANYLAQQLYVDPNRIYLGGHSTGGTLALLVSECSPRFRGVFSFGPIHDVSYYGADSGFLPFDLSNPQEVQLRSPIYWLSSIHSPVWVFKGTDGNSEPLHLLARESQNPRVHFIEVRGASHFNVLAPTTELIAAKVRQDTGPQTNLTFTEDEANRSFGR